MKSTVALISFVFSLLSFPAFAVAGNASPEEAHALVRKAIDYYKKYGRAKATAAFNQAPGPFVDRDLYVTVYTMDGDALAHINPRIVGKNMIEFRDPDGKYIVRERVEAASRGISGWQDYKYYNPVSRQVEPKRMYWERFDHLIFAAGAYNPR